MNKKLIVQYLLMILLLLTIHFDDGTSNVVFWVIIGLGMANLAWITLMIYDYEKYLRDNKRK